MQIRFDLNRCPFCGGEAEIVATAAGPSLFGVHCKSCDVLVGHTSKGFTEFFRTPLAAADAWNRRAN